MTIQGYTAHQPPVPELRDCWQRLAWADSNAQTLEYAIRTFVGSNPYPIKIEPHGQRWQAVIETRISLIEQTRAFTEFSRQLGYWLENTRAALNYLAYQFALLALRKDPTLKGTVNPEAIEFPIFTSERAFTKYNRIKGLPDPYWQFMVDVQPYKGGHEDLGVLHELARKFRHRLIAPMPVLPRTDFHGLNAVGVTDIEIVHEGPLKRGDVLFTFMHADGNVNPNAALSIGASDASCWGRDCIEIVNGINADVMPIIDTAAAFFR